MKVVPKLSGEQLRILDRLRRSEASSAKIRKTPQQQPPLSIDGKPWKDAQKAHFCVADRVELVCDVAETAYRAGQQGVIRALHGMPAKVAEVELDSSGYSDVVRLRDLRSIG